MMRCLPCLQVTRLNSTDAMIDPADFNLELQEIAAESIGWLPLGDRAYLHVGSEETEIIEVVGIPTPEMQGLTVLLVY